MFIAQFLILIVIALVLGVGIYFQTKARVGCGQYNLTIMSFHAALIDAQRIVIILQNNSEHVVKINEAWVFKELAKISRRAKPSKELCDSCQTKLQFIIDIELQKSKFDCWISEMKTDDLIVAIPDWNNLGTNVHALLPGLNRWLIENVEGYNELLEEVSGSDLD